jgi:hypothetical protein
MADAPKRQEKSDPTVKGDPAPWGAYQEDRGNHPIRPLSEQTYAAQNIEYVDNPNKPDPTTIAQVEKGTEVGETPNKP